jgi:transcription elongation factor GreA
MNLEINEVRSRLSEALNQASTALTHAPSETELQETVARLGQLVAGLAMVDMECLPAIGAGYGSTVVVENVKSGSRAEYTLMVGPLVDIDANQVSLASPIGQALLGRVAGEEIVFVTPQGPLRMRVIAVTTLMEAMSDAVYI